MGLLAPSTTYLGLVHRLSHHRFLRKTSRWIERSAGNARVFHTATLRVIACRTCGHRAVLTDRRRSSAGKSSAGIIVVAQETGPEVHKVRVKDPSTYFFRTPLKRRKSGPAAERQPESSLRGRPGSRGYRQKVSVSGTEHRFTHCCCTVTTPARRCFGLASRPAAGVFLKPHPNCRIVGGWKQHDDTAPPAARAAQGVGQAVTAGSLDLSCRPALRGKSANQPAKEPRFPGRVALA